MKDIMKTLRISEDLNNKIKCSSEKLNMSESDYIRLSINEMLQRDYSNDDIRAQLNKKAKETESILNKYNRVFVYVKGNLKNYFEYFYDEAECSVHTNSTNESFLVRLFNNDCSNGTSKAIGKFYMGINSQIEIREKISNLEINVVCINII